MSSDSIESARLAREAREAEERLALRRHKGREPSDPPWPGMSIRQGRPDEGTQHLDHVELAHKSFKNVWGILALIIAIFGTGFAANNTIRDLLHLSDDLKLLKTQLDEMKQVHSLNQVTNEFTMTNMQKDIAEVKSAVKVHNNPDPPLKAEKNKRHD